jgi:hypothetical protein
MLDVYIVVRTLPLRGFSRNSKVVADACAGRVFISSRRLLFSMYSCTSCTLYTCLAESIRDAVYTQHAIFLCLVVHFNRVLGPVLVQPLK